MKSVVRLKVLLAITAVVTFGGSYFGVVAASSRLDRQSVVENLSSIQFLNDATASATPPVIVNPVWLEAELAVKRVTVTYSVETRGTLTADSAEFKTQANQTLNDSRGWGRMGVVFQEVASGGSFTLVLSEASYLPSFSSGCSVDYSCRSGRYVIINQDRWLGATTAWNNGGGSLRDYRHMVVNHETGHWLGHDHQSCSVAGQPAPLMQQQSISLQGCTFNAWPLDSEMWSTQLGIQQ